MVKIIKLTEDGKFSSYVNIREERKDISFPDNLENAKLPDGYAVVKFEDVVQELGFIITYEDLPVLTENGWIINVKEITPEEKNITVISEITMRQARLKLLELDLLDEVEAMVSQDKKHQIEWEYGSVVERDSKLIDGIKILLSLSDEQIDQMFLDASKL